MKNFSFTLVWVLCIIASAVTSTNAQNAQEEAIKKTIKEETLNFYALNYDAWMQHFVQTPYFLWSVTNGFDPGDVVTFRGWDAFRDSMKASWYDIQTKEGAQEAYKSTKTTEHDWNIQIRGDVAWISFRQITKTPTQTVESTETRVMERIKGSWKIAMQSTLMDFKDATPPMRTSY